MRKGVHIRSRLLVLVAVLLGLAAVPAAAGADRASHSADRTTPRAAGHGRPAASRTIRATPRTALADAKRATRSAGQPAAGGTPKIRIEVPKAAGVPLVVGADGSAQIGLPVTGAGAPAPDGSRVFSGEHQGSQLVVQPSEWGARALIRIGDASASRFYRFTLGGDVAQLQAGQGGMIFAYDRSQRLIGAIPPAWARDANGNAVATHYEIQGTDIVQVVDHRQAGVAYPVVADPFFLFDLLGGVSQPVSNLVGSLGNALGIGGLTGSLGTILGLGTTCGGGALLAALGSTLHLDLNGVPSALLLGCLAGGATYIVDTYFPGLKPYLG